ncbi:MAG: NAD(P)H-dependent oxidoreductase subunit E [Dehalococcoidia bacterium]|mgnify:CR=1 FL=1
MPENSKLLDKIKHSLESQEQPTVTILSSLLSIQDDLHYIPNEGISETAKFCGKSTNEVWSVASFYTNFRFTPPGDNVVDVCWGPTCHLLGAQIIIDSLQKKLEIDGEGESKDGKITLKYNTCLGACAQAPCIAIDHYIHGRQDKNTAIKIINEIRNK